MTWRNKERLTFARGEPLFFTGTIKRVTVNLSGELIPASEADLKIAMMRQ